MAERDKIENHLVQRHKECYTESCRAISEKSKRVDPWKRLQNCLYSSGITEGNDSVLTAQLLPLNPKISDQRSHSSTILRYKIRYSTEEMPQVDRNGANE